MKNLSTALVVPLLLLAPSAFDATPDTGATRDVPDFDGVEVGTGLKAKVTVGPKSVRISGDEKRVAEVQTEVVNGTLQVRLEKKGWFGSTSSRGIEVTISSPQVKYVGASGGADVEAEATATETFRAEASGGGEVYVRNVDAKKLSVETSGGGEVTVKGRADTLDAEASGGAEVHAQGLSLKALIVDASGGASVEANPTDSIEADLSGGCSVHVESTPAQRSISASGGSSVHFRK